MGVRKDPLKTMAEPHKPPTNKDLLIQKVTLFEGLLGTAKRYCLQKIGWWKIILVMMVFAQG